MAFRTQYERICKCCNPGGRFVTTYQYKIDEDGTENLVESGKIDLYADIQAYKESCDIDKILERYACGDTSALNARPIFYGDISDAPQSLAQHIQLLRDAEQAFDRLPVAVRESFDNDVIKFYSQIGTDDFYKSLGVSLDPDDVKEEKEVSKNEQE